MERNITYLTDKEGMKQFDKDCKNIIKNYNMKTLNLANPESSDIKYKHYQYPDGQQQIVIKNSSLSKINRDGKLVIRPDSGDPVDIICGTLIPGGIRYKTPRPEHIGVIELLWNTFGGIINEQGYKVLDSHIGAIYGDYITLERAEQICERLKAKGFASTNIVFGVGSYSMGYATRDSQGGAVKSTYVEINGEGVEIFKNPITDDGTKKSLKGLLKVTYGEDGEIICKDQQTIQEVCMNNLLTPLYRDGMFLKATTLDIIRNKFNHGL